MTGFSYRCDRCGESFELDEGSPEQAPAQCPNCGADRTEHGVIEYQAARPSLRRWVSIGLLVAIGVAIALAVVLLGVDIK